MKSMFSLKRQDVHLWLVRDQEIVEPALLERYRSWLSPEEDARRQRFYFEKDRHQFLITRALVRHGLSCFDPSVAEMDWRFENNEYGRPRLAGTLANHAGWTFNVSHTKGLVVMAVCRDVDLGVDVEATLRQGKTTELAERFFSGRETTDLQALPELQRRDRFFDLWTLKESYIKARGMGLSIPLDAFSFFFPDPTSIGFSAHERAADPTPGWRFWQFSADSSYKISLAYRALPPTPRVAIHAARVVPGRHLTPIMLHTLRVSKEARFPKRS